MAFSKKRPQSPVSEIHQIPVQKLVPSASQPRTCFDSQSLRELALSIEQHGILQPLSVRRVGSKFELIAGERRLRAAKLAGLSSVPCMVLQADDTESSLLSLIENVQRRDLDFFETAQGYQRLIQSFGLTQEQVALRIGKTQSAVANKLRLLRFDADLISFIRAAALTERHCRAVLRLPSSQYRSVLEQIAAQTLTVAQTETLVDSLLLPEKTAASSVHVAEYFSSVAEENSAEDSSPKSAKASSPTEESVHNTESVSFADAEPSFESNSEINSVIASAFDTASADSQALKTERQNFRQRKIADMPKSETAVGKMLVKDARIFLNTILHAFDLMKASGIDALCQQHEEADYTELLIRIPRCHVENNRKIPIEPS